MGQPTITEASNGEEDEGHGQILLEMETMQLVVALPAVARKKS
jgi:hypothetical protein